MIGIILAAVAVVVPGLGLPEIGSITFVIAGVILAVDSISTALFTLSIAIILTTIISVMLIKLGFTSKLLNKVVLKSKHSDEQGFLSTDTMEHYLNKEGITSTELRPTGFIVIEGKRVDALSDGEFISKGVKVKVVRIDGSNIFVRRI